MVESSQINGTKNTSLIESVFIELWLLVTGGPRDIFVGVHLMLYFLDLSIVAKKIEHSLSSSLISAGIKIFEMEWLELFQLKTNAFSRINCFLKSNGCLVNKS